MQTAHDDGAAGVGLLVSGLDEGLEECCLLTGQRDLDFHLSGLPEAGFFLPLAGKALHCT